MMQHPPPAKKTTTPLATNIPTHQHITIERTATLRLSDGSQEAGLQWLAEEDLEVDVEVIH